MRNSNSEYILLIILILIFSIGIVADILVFKDICIWLVVEDLNDIIKTLLGIQSTVAVLSFSILSLISSYTDKSYWGISITDFYTNKKNKIFKSKVVISLGLCFIVISFFALFLEVYNFIIAVFISTIIIILWQTLNIYFVFNGDSAIQEDIENMFFSVFNNTNNKTEKIELFNTYCNGWEKIILEQSEIDFEKYKLDFLNFLNYLLEEKDADCIKSICNNARRISVSLLISSKEIKKQQGIQFLNLFYQTFWVSISDEILNNSSFMENFGIISDIIKEFLEAIKSVSKEWLSDNFDWFVFTEYIDTIAISFQTKTSQQELYASLRIALFMGLL